MYSPSPFLVTTFTSLLLSHSSFFIVLSSLLSPFLLCHFPAEHAAWRRGLCFACHCIFGSHHTAPHRQGTWIMSVEWMNLCSTFYLLFNSLLSWDSLLLKFVVFIYFVSPFLFSLSSYLPCFCSHFPPTPSSPCSSPFLPAFFFQKFPCLTGQPYALTTFFLQCVVNPRTVCFIRYVICREWGQSMISRCLLPYFTPLTERVWHLRDSVVKSLLL